MRQINLFLLYVVTNFFFASLTVISGSTPKDFSLISIELITFFLRIFLNIQ